MVKRYVLIDTDDANPSDIDFELGPVYETDVAPPEESYVATATALEYFADDPRATAFIALSSTVLAWYLARATKIIDALPLRGTKYLIDGSQILQFPRQYREGYDMDELTGVAEVPQQVKDACCEEALALYLEQAGGGSSRAALQEAGVQSYTIPGILQETFAPGAVSANRNGGMRSPAAYRLLSRFIARSVPII